MVWRGLASDLDAKIGRVLVQPRDKDGFDDVIEGLILFGHGPKPLRKGRNKGIGQKHPQERADQNAEHDAPDHAPLHGSPPVMGHEARHRGEHDAGK